MCELSNAEHVKTLTNSPEGIADKSTGGTMNKLKGALRSKTIRLNAFVVPALIMLETNFHYLKSTLGDNWYGILFIVVSAANIYLRTVTTESLEDKGNDKLLR